MKIYFARKKVSDDVTIQVFEWEAEEKRAMYILTDASAWFKRVRRGSIGMPSNEGAFGLTKEEAVAALKRLRVSGGACREKGGENSRIFERRRN